MLVEFDPHFCRLLRERYPTATVIQGDAYGLRHLLTTLVQKPAAAVVSGLPLFTKPLHTRLRLLYEAFALMMPGAPFIQFTYAAVSPIPKSHGSVRAQASERIWTQLPAGARLGLPQALTRTLSGCGLDRRIRPAQPIPKLDDGSPAESPAMTV